MRVSCAVLVLFAASCGMSTNRPSDAGIDARVLDAGADTLVVDGGTDANALMSDAGPHAGSACAMIDALDQECTVDADCASAIHAADCCGTFRAIGFATHESERYAMLEPLCEASYPACGCAARPTFTDSGEVVSSPSDVHVACVTRITLSYCETYVTMRPPDAM